MRSEGRLGSTFSLVLQSSLWLASTFFSFEEGPQALVGDTCPQGSTSANGLGCRSFLAHKPLDVCTCVVAGWGAMFPAPVQYRGGGKGTAAASSPICSSGASLQLRAMVLELTLPLPTLAHVAQPLPGAQRVRLPQGPHCLFSKLSFPVSSLGS